MNFDCLAKQIIEENSNSLISNFDYSCRVMGPEDAVQDFLASKDSYNSFIKDEAETHVKNKVGEEMYNKAIEIRQKRLASPVFNNNNTMPEIPRRGSDAAVQRQGWRN
jgi:hypothetical protein